MDWRVFFMTVLVGLALVGAGFGIMYIAVEKPDNSVASDTERDFSFADTIRNIFFGVEEKRFTSPPPPPAPLPEPAPAPTPSPTLGPSPSPAPLPSPSPPPSPSPSPSPAPSPTPSPSPSPGPSPSPAPPPPTPPPAPTPSPSPAPPPSPPNPPPPPPPQSGTLDSIAVAGCSQTKDWIGDGPVSGYEDIYGVNLFTPAGSFSGGSIERWTDESGYMRSFRNRTTGNEDAILVQVCVNTTRTTTYNDLVNMINLLKAEVQNVPVYLMPLDVSPQSSPACDKAGYDESVSFIGRAIQSGLGAQGPWMLPLYSPGETRDGCHPTDAGAARNARVVHDFFFGSN